MAVEVGVAGEGEEEEVGVYKEVSKSWKDIVKPVIIAGWSKGGGDSYQRSYSVDSYGGHWGGGERGGAYDGSYGGFYGASYDPNYGYDNYSGTYGNYRGGGGGGYQRGYSYEDRGPGGGQYGRRGGRGFQHQHSNYY